MNANRKFIVLLSGAFVLCLGLPNLALAINNFSEELKDQEMNQEAQEQGGIPGLAEKEADAAKGISTIHGQVLQVDHDEYLIRKYDGDVVRFHIDDKTQVRGPLRQGDRIVAKVNDREIALKIEPLPLLAQ